MGPWRFSTTGSGARAPRGVLAASPRTCPLSVPSAAPGRGQRPLLVPRAPHPSFQTGGPQASPGAAGSGPPWLPIRAVHWHLVSITVVNLF